MILGNNIINNSDFIDLFLLEYNYSKIIATYNEKVLFFLPKS